ncbi:MAG: MFS transporter [Actinomycetota bacterium]
MIDSPRAWSVAVAAAINNGVAFGIVYTFGTFFEAMAEEFGAGRGPTSIVFAVTLFLFFGTGAASGFLADRYGPRPLVLVGGTMFVAGLVLTSQVEVLWHGYLTYGLGAGLGGGLFVSPMYAAVAGWFDRYRALGQGVAATGNGLGTLIMLPLANWLIGNDGWRSAYVTLAVIAAVIFAVCSVFARRPPIDAPPSASRHLRAVMRTSSFRVMVVGGLLGSAAQASAFAFTVVFATDEGVSSADAALLVGLIGAASIMGRLALTGLSDRTGPVRMLQYCLVGQPIAFAVLLIAGGDYRLLLLYALIYGVAYGGFVALIGQVAAHLFGVRGLASVLGFLFLGAGVGSLVWPPVVGFIADASGANTLPKLAIVAVAAAGAVWLFRLSPDPVPPEELATEGPPTTAVTGADGVGSVS